MKVILYGKRKKGRTSMCTKGVAIAHDSTSKIWDTLRKRIFTRVKKEGQTP
jgi:hypothetical protein